MARRRGIPLGLLGALAGALLLWRLDVLTGLSGDVFWQWAAGRFMIQHHLHLVTHDPFSYTLYGRPWYDPEWGYQLLLAVLINAIGPVAFWIMAAGVGTLTVWTVAAAARAAGAGYTWAGLLALVTGLGLFLFVRDRPQELSYLFFAGMLALLTLARRNRRLLFVLPPLLLVWANIHESFLLGLLVLGLETLWAWVPIQFGRLRTLPLPRGSITGTWVLSLVAACVNPHGPGLLRYALADSANSRIGNLIAEWQPPDFHIMLLLLLVVGPLAVLLLWLSSRDDAIDWPLSVLTGGLLIATLHGVRFFPYWIIAWSVLAARLSPWNRMDGRVPWWVLVPLAGILSVGMLFGKTIPPGTPANEPVQAVRYLAHHSGRVFSTYRWGDYLVGEGVPVFIDGRTNFYAGTGVLAAFLRISGLDTNPDPVLARYRVDYVLWTPKTPLAVFLANDPRWTIVYRSSKAVIYKRTHPPS